MAFSSGTVSIGASTKKSDYDNLLDNTQWNKGRLDTVYSGTNTFAGAKTFTDTSTFSGNSIFSGTITDKNGIEVTGMQIETKIKEDVVTGLAQDSITDIDVTGFGFTPTAVLDVAISIWDTGISENLVAKMGSGQGAHASLFGGATGSDVFDGEGTAVAITKATPGANKVTVRVAIYNLTNGNVYYRITCTAAKT